MRYSFTYLKFPNNNIDGNMLTFINKYGVEKMTNISILIQF